VEISIAKFTRNVVKAILFVGIAFAILNKLGIQTTSFLAIFASVGVGIGMALSGTLQNFAGGVMVLLTRPFKIGDYVIMQGIEGSVKEIRLFSTTINTVDNKVICACTETREQSVPFTFNEIDFNTKTLCDLFCDFHVKADKCICFIMIAERLPVAFQTDRDCAGILNLLQMISGCCRRR
jgi:hypothetical protein